MAIIDLARVSLAVATDRSRTLEHPLTTQPAFDVLGVLAHGYAMADEPARPAVLRTFDGEDTVLAHARGEFIELPGSARRQRPQQRAFDD